MKKLLRVLTVLLLALVVLAGVFNERLSRLYSMITLYDADKIVENFSNTDKSFLTVSIPAGNAPALDTLAGEFALPDSFKFAEQTLSTNAFIEETDTTALVVMHSGEVVFENYLRGTDKQDKRISFSTAKSFLSVLVGIAIDEGSIPSVDVAVTDYVPSLKGTSYDDATLEDVLEMSSGVAFNENYRQFDSDINRMSRLLALGGSMDEFAGSLAKQRAAGEAMQYVSIDTHVVGMVLRSATGVEVADYFYDKLWRYIGGEQGAYYGTDSTGQPVVLGGLNMRTRDYARLGQLVLNDGRWGDQQVVSEQWIKDSTTTKKSRLQPTDNEYGYAYQWWIPPHVNDEVLAVGIYGQYIYINKALDIVIAKNSADIEFMDNGYISKHQSLAFFRAVARKLYLESTLESYSNALIEKNKQAMPNLELIVSLDDGSERYEYGNGELTSLYEIGSTSKWFTAITVLDVLDSKVDATIDDWLTGSSYQGLCVYRETDCFKQLTVLNLLNHTSSIADYLDVHGSDEAALKLFSDTTYHYTHQELYKIAKEHADTSSQPNQQWAYTNTGYLLLADIIEKASGVDWRQAVKRSVLEPAELADTYFGEMLTEQQIARRPQGYYQGMKTQIPYSAASSAGEMLATSDDLHAFMKWWANSEFANIQTNTGLVTMMPGVADYGLGVIKHDSLVGHAGQTFGFQAYAGRDINTGLQIVILANDAKFSAMGEAFSIYADVKKLPYQ